MNYLFLINTLLGFVIAQIADVLTRNKSSEHSPQKFNIEFFLKDNWGKILTSLILSFSISSLLYLNVEELGKLFGKDLPYLNNLIYAAIGAAPEFVLQILKKRLGFLQPTEVSVTVTDEDGWKDVDTFNRKK